MLKVVDVDKAFIALRTASLWSIKTPRTSMESTRVRFKWVQLRRSGQWPPKNRNIIHIRHVLSWNHKNFVVFSIIDRKKKSNHYSLQACCRGFHMFP
jgi:hypothetical protein